MADDHAQGRWYELLSPTQVLTGDNEKAVPKTTTEDATTKHHNEGSSGSLDQDIDETVSHNCTDSDEEEEQSVQVSVSYFGISSQHNLFFDNFVSRNCPTAANHAQW